jgi:hypothetical protein
MASRYLRQLTCRLTQGRYGKGDLQEDILINQAAHWGCPHAFVMMAHPPFVSCVV